MRYKTYTLQQLATIRYGKNQRAVESKDGPYPIYGTGGVVGYATEPLYCKPSVLIGRKGTIDKVRYVDFPFWTIDTLFYTEINTDIVLPRYFYYLMTQVDLSKLNEGTTIPSLRTEALNRLEFKVPSIVEQKQQIELLILLENKIALNNMINQNLQQQAADIYKAWFIDYISYNEVYPSNWKTVLLSDIARVTSGKRPSTRVSTKTDEANIPLVGATSIMGYTNESNFDSKILVIGRVGTHGVVQRFDTPCWASDNTLVISSRYYEFVYQILNRIDYSSLNRGSTQPLITQGDINKVEVLLPDEVTILKYEEIAHTLMDKYDTINDENTKLAELRDTLLPKLISGEIDVSELGI